MTSDDTVRVSENGNWKFFTALTGVVERDKRVNAVLESGFLHIPGQVIETLYGFADVASLAIFCFGISEKVSKPRSNQMTKFERLRLSACDGFKKYVSCKSGPSMIGLEVLTSFMATPIGE